MVASLDQIVAAARLSVDQRRKASQLEHLEKQAQKHTPRGFRQRLLQSGEKLAVIAELKKASPSRGLIRGNFDSESLAKELAQAGATALSVLTDQEFFQGSLGNLRIASANTSLPCLRKDFIVDEFQLLEARANSADAVLLIVAALSQNELVSLNRRAADYELDVLCETHDEEEVKRALGAGCTLIGVNSRNLRTFQVDLQTAFRLAKAIPDHVVRVAESGIHNGADLRRLRDAGYDAFLIGESLMAAASPGAALRKLLLEANAATALK
jgi:indole-3-glycerol phosphate synthase